MRGDVQYNPATDCVVLSSRYFRELMERCGELPAVVPVECAMECKDCAGDAVIGASMSEGK
jgi:hypothetical protein